MIWSCFSVTDSSDYSARSEASVEYWINFRARFGGVHASGYNSAKSGPIWMKYEALWVHCRRLARQILGTIRAVATAGEPGEIFFGQVNNARFHRFLVRQISRNLNTKRRSVSRWNPSEQKFENVTLKGRFSNKRKNLSQIFNVLRLQATIR